MAVLGLKYQCTRFWGEIRTLELANQRREREATPSDDPTLRLSLTIQKMNEIFAENHSDLKAERWVTAVIGNVSAHISLTEQAIANPTPAQFANGDNRGALSKSITRALESHHSMSEQALQNL